MSFIFRQLRLLLTARILRRGCYSGVGVNRRFARDDLRGTGKLEIIVMTAELFDYWRHPPDPDDTYFGVTQVELGSAATE